MSTQSRKRRARCSLELHGSTYRIVYSWEGRGRVRCRTPFNRDDADKAFRLADLMRDLLAARRDPRVDLAGMPLSFTPSIHESSAHVTESTLDALAASAAPAEERGTTECEEGLAPNAATRVLTIDGYYRRWVARMVYPAVRKAQERDYRRHFEGYILPRVGRLPITEFTASALCDVRDDLVSNGGQNGASLSRKYVRNILGASMRAMIRAALDDGLLQANPYSSKRWAVWPKSSTGVNEGGEADPFTPEERDRILAWFRDRTYGVRGVTRLHPAFLGWVTVQFHAGLSPSEASGLQWGDVDFDPTRPFVIVRRSYHLGRYNEPKTRRRRRTAVIPPDLAELIRALQPLAMREDLPLFPNTHGVPIEPKSFAHWYRGLRALKIRVRGAYAMKDTFVSIALMSRTDPQWLEQQTGVALQTLKAHYARYFPGIGQQELAKMSAYEKSTLTPALTPDERESEVPDGEKTAERRRIRDL